MGVIITCSILSIVGILLLRFAYDTAEVIGFILTLVNGILLVIFICAAIGTIIRTTNLHIGYENDKAYLEQVYNNENITDNERVKSTQLIIQDNGIILSSQHWHNNFWIGWFYPNLNDLAPFEQKVPLSKTKIEIDK